MGLPLVRVKEQKGSLPAHVLPEIHSCLGFIGRLGFCLAFPDGGMGNGESSSPFLQCSYCAESSHGAASHPSFPNGVPMIKAKRRQEHVDHI